MDMHRYEWRNEPAVRDGHVRYSVDTRLTVKEAMAQARGYFGPNGRVGLAVTQRGLYRTVFAGGGGYVVATAHRSPMGSRIELEVWQFDMEARAFLATLPGPRSRLSRFWRR